jgi:hypothetical protein
VKGHNCLEEKEKEKKEKEKEKEKKGGVRRRIK